MREIIVIISVRVVIIDDIVRVVIVDGQSSSSTTDALPSRLSASLSLHSLPLSHSLSRSL